MHSPAFTAAAAVVSLALRFPLCGSQLGGLLRLARLPASKGKLTMLILYHRLVAHCIFFSQSPFTEYYEQCASYLLNPQR